VTGECDHLNWPRLAGCSSRIWLRLGGDAAGWPARHRVHRRTVRQALASAVPPRKLYQQRPGPAIDPYKPVIGG